jgi:hypothetical protein
MLPAYSIGFLRFPAIIFDIWPMLWAIGYIMGHRMIIPLLIGAVLKVCMVDPLHYIVFTHLTSTELSLAFASGLVLYGALMSFIDLPNACIWLYKTGRSLSLKTLHTKISITTSYVVQALLLSIATISYFLWTGFSVPAITFIVVGTLLCSYQIAVIAGKIGLAPLGRFATFIMVPAMLLFSLTYEQIVITATFVEICAGVVADVLFSQTMARMGNVQPLKIMWFQYVGVLATACSVGIIMLLITTHIPLGSAQLCAYKAQSRHLLIAVQAFDWRVLLIGFGLGALLNTLRINTMLVLGGLLMPLNIITGLSIGGIISAYAARKAEWEPFWSGVFTGNSIWMLISLFLSR